MVLITGTHLGSFGRAHILRLFRSRFGRLNIPFFTPVPGTSRPLLAPSTRLSTTFSACVTSFSSATSADLRRPQLRCTEVDQYGSITTRYISSEKTARGLTTLFGLMPRDIRKLAGSTLSHIRLRPSTVLLHLSHLKVLIRSDRVLLFDDATGEASRSAFLRELGDRLRSRGDTPQVTQQDDEECNSQVQLAFEFHALEAVLSSVALRLEGELELIRSSVERVLNALEDDVDRRMLITLLTLSNEAVRFANEAQLVLDVVDDLYERDDHVAGLYLSTSMTEDDDLTIANRLLDSYYITYNEIVQEAQNFVSSIRNTQESANAMLDANRNSMMVLDLRFRLGALSLASGSLFSAFYGMNISSGIGSVSWAFPAVSGTSAVIAAATLCYLLDVLRKLVRVRMMEGYRKNAS